MLAALVEACGLDVTVLDDASTIGAMALVAEPQGRRNLREDVQLANPEQASYARESSAEFIAYMARLETLPISLRCERVALYGAGFYGTLVKAQLDAAKKRVIDVFDANPRKQGTYRLGVWVRSPDDLSSGEWKDVDLVICVNPQIAFTVGERLAAYVRAVHVI
jgi:hypothetical protein